MSGLAHRVHAPAAFPIAKRFLYFVWRLCVGAWRPKMAVYFRPGQCPTDNIVRLYEIQLLAPIPSGPARAALFTRPWRSPQ